MRSITRAKGKQTERRSKSTPIRTGDRDCREGKTGREEYHVREEGMEGGLSIFYDEDAARDKSQGRSSKLNIERRNGRGLTIDATVPGTGGVGFKLTRRWWPFDSICLASRPRRKFNLNRTVYVWRVSDGRIKW